MDEDLQKKVDLYSQQLDRLKGVVHEQEVLMKTLSTVQFELEEGGEKEFCDAVVKVVTETSKNHDALKEIISTYEIEVNRIRNENA